MSLVQAYRATRYIVLEGRHVVVGRIGRHSPDLDGLLARRRSAGGSFITAWNPMSVAAPARLNEAAQRRLEQALTARRCRFLPHIGLADDQDWREDGVLALDLSAEDALAVAVRHGQAAIVRAEPGEPLRLMATRLASAGA